jgi:DNA-binding transcriptional ArsR family regulator
MGRLEFERAIRRSDLPSPSRHLALTLATWANISSGIIPDDYQPSLSTLEEATGLSRKTVRTHLDILEDTGWVERDRPDPAKARAEGARTFYTLHIPPGVAGRGTDPLPVGAERPHRNGGVGAERPQPGGGDPPPVGAEIPLSRGGDPLKNPNSPESLKSRAGGGPSGPVPPAGVEQRAGSERKSRKAGPGQGQMPLLLSVQDTGSPTASLHHQLAEQMTEHYGTSVTVRHAAAVALVVLADRTPHNPLAYVMSAVRRDPERHRPTNLPPAYRAPHRRAAGDA